MAIGPLGNSDPDEKKISSEESAAAQNDAAGQNIRSAQAAPVEHVPDNAPDAKTDIASQEQETRRISELHASDKKAAFVDWLKSNSTVAKTLIDLEQCRNVSVKAVAGKIAKFKDDMVKRTPGVQFSPITKYRNAAPCSSSWDKMSGSGTIKYCEQCRLMVYDFSSVELEQAELIVFKREEKKECTLYKRRDGKFLSSDCPVGQAGRRTFFMVMAVPSALMVAALVFLITHPVPLATVFALPAPEREGKSEKSTQAAPVVVLSPFVAERSKSDLEGAEIAREHLRGAKFKASTGLHD